MGIVTGLSSVIQVLEVIFSGEPTMRIAGIDRGSPRNAAIPAWAGDGPVLS
jgi:hypothetical protein